MAILWLARRLLSRSPLKLTGIEGDKLHEGTGVLFDAGAKEEPIDDREYRGA
jgi:hypothetical protein